jgi:hypothetical protein
MATTTHFGSVRLSSTLRPALQSAGRALASLLILLSADAIAHGAARLDETATPAGEDRRITFPDTADRLTLTVDLHTHSVFSDGHVWPRIRVGEAIRDGLDALAITEHLEWQPHLADIPHPDRNRAYQEAVASLPETSELIIIAGSEITRRAPYGHMNAVFIRDANALVQPGAPTEPFDPRAYYLESSTWPAQAVLDEANAQGAFVFWNHSWSNFSSNMTEITDFHREAAAAGKLHGIEIANGGTYSPESFQIALEYGLTPIGVSDVHNLIDWDYEPNNGGHRPVNLVFAKERSVEGIRDALFEGRTVVWFKNLLFGREEHLKALIDACLSVASAAYLNSGSVLEFVIENRSDASFQLENLTDYSLTSSGDILTVSSHGRTTARLRLPQRESAVELDFRVRNALNAPGSHQRLRFAMTLEPSAAD